VVSVLADCLILAMNLCRTAEQLEAWWEWPAHREARHQLDGAEMVAIANLRVERMRALEAMHRT
jgi:hypothetical protein